MAYSNAVFYIDPENGNDAARTALTGCIASNPSGTTTRINRAAHGLVTGAVVDLTSFTSWLNSAWKITVVDADNFDLDGAVWQATADNDGTVTPRGGSSKADAWKTASGGITSSRVKAGDTVRLIASPDPTALGDATWTSAKFASATSIGTNASTNASPIVINAGASHGLVTGDSAFVTGHNTNTNANGFWKVTVSGNFVTLLNADGTNSVGNGIGSGGSIRKMTNCVVELASALTKNVALCGNRNQKPNWTASANVTCTVVTSDQKEGSESLSVAVSAAFTTGKAAYYTLPSAMDLSAYQQLSFWLKQTIGTPVNANGDLSITLCSDTSGDTPLHTFSIPALSATPFWIPFTVDNGSALSSGVNSIALYVNNDRGAATFLLDNIIACLAPSDPASLSLTSLIGKSTEGEHWWPIQSINDKRVVLDGYKGTTLPAGQRGYFGASENVTTYKRECIILPTSPGSLGSVSSAAGTAASPITVSGGWDRTAMASQSGETWIDNGRTNTVAMAIANSFYAIDNVHFAHSNSGSGAFQGSSNDLTVGSMSVVGSTVASQFSMNRLTVTGTLRSSSCVTSHQIGGTVTAGHNINAIETVSAISAAAVVSAGVGNFVGSWTHENCGATPQFNVGLTVGSVLSESNGSNGITLTGGCVIGTATVNNNSGVGILCSGSVGGAAVVLGGSTTGNSSKGAGTNSTTAQAQFTLRNFTLSDSTPISHASSTASTSSRLVLENIAGVANAHAHYLEEGLIQTQTTTVYDGSAYAWRFSPTGVNRNAQYPLDLPIARVYCEADALVSVNARVRRNNTGLTMRLKCKGGQLAGVGSVGTDITAESAAAADTWEQLTITFTPTEAGVVELTMEAWGGSAWSGYYDPHDLQITQA